MTRHKLLARQLKRSLGIADTDDLNSTVAALASVTLGDRPLGPALANLINAVDEAYQQYDRDLVLRTRSLELSSNELTQANERLREESAAQQRILQSLRLTTNRLLDSTNLPQIAPADTNLEAITHLLSTLMREREETQEKLRKNEAQYRLVLESLNEVVYQTDWQGKIEFVNPAWQQITGFGLAATQGTSLLDYVYADDRDQVVTALTPLILGQQKKAQYQARLATANGGTRWIDANVQAFFDQDGQFAGATGTLTDITARHEAEQQLKDTRSQLINAIESLDAGFVMYDKNDKLAICNQRYKEIYRAAAPAMRPGTSYREILQYFIDHQGLGESDVDKVSWVNNRLEEHHRGGANGVEQKIGDRWIRVNDSRTQDGSVVSLRTDITELKHIQQELLQAIEAAKAANVAKSHFLANMSHEIRTPMNGIIGMTELTLETELTQEQREFLSIVRTSAESLLVIVNDILDFSKIEAGKMSMESVDFSLREVLNDTMKALSLKAAAKNIEVITRINPTVPHHVAGDPGRLRQIITNLVGNAIKFTERGEISLRVSVETANAMSCRLQFAVCDTGIGIAMEKQSLIFEAFSQADASTTRQYGGTGLGLTISSRLVEMMGGQMAVESELGKGSCFSFSAQFGICRASQLHCSPLPLAGKRLLVVDDNQTNAIWLQEMAHHWHMQVDLCSNTDVAINSILHAATIGQTYDLLLLDWNMNAAGGYAFVQRLLQHTQLPPHSIMIMLATASERNEAQRCRDLGIHTYLLKPLAEQELLDGMLACIGQEQHSPAIDTLEHSTELPVAASALSLNILLAEDNPVNQKLARHLLEKMGHKVTVADNGQLALAHMLQQPFDLVLMDVQMPVMGGFEAIEKWRKYEQETGKSHLPVIALTAHAMQGDRERCLAAGMDGYVTKPIRAALLAAEILRLAVPHETVSEIDRQATAAPPTGMDLALLLEQLDGNTELRAELAVMMLDSYETQLAIIKQSLAQGNISALQQATHALKGSMGVFPMDAANANIAKLDNMAQQQKTEGFADQLARLETEMAIVLPQLRRCLER